MHMIALACVITVGFAAFGAQCTPYNLHVVSKTLSLSETCDAENGTVACPFTSLHAARAFLDKCDERGPRVIKVGSGTHKLNGKTLYVGSNEHWIGSNATISGGELVTNWTEVTKGHWVAPLATFPDTNPKSARIGSRRAVQATFPSQTQTDLQDRYLFARNVEKITNNDTATWLHVDIDLEDMPVGWQSWTNVVAYVWPANSWVSLRVTARPDPYVTLGNGLARFIFICPEGSSGLRVGNRIIFAGDVSLLGTSGASGVWAADPNSKLLHVLSASEPQNFFVPTLRASSMGLMAIVNRSNVSIAGITFADMDFAASGSQNGFNAQPSDGPPHDGALVVSDSHDVVVNNVVFLAIAGGGVIIGNRSTRVTVQDSTFLHMGQSGVMLVGNDTTQPSYCMVRANNISGVGEILSSAGGVVISSASHVHVSANNISRSSRWGISLRSNPSASSYNNTIEGNRITDTGLLTADFGAISLIDHTPEHNTSGNVIRGNCVRRVHGLRDAFFRQQFGVVFYNFWGRAVYLDDRTSNVDISGNVFVDASHASIFVHSGSNNSVHDNVLVRGADMSILLKTITKARPVKYMHGNRVQRNVFVTPISHNHSARPPPFLQGPLGSPLTEALAAVDHNLYFTPGDDFVDPDQPLWIGRNFTRWVALHYGQGSLLNQDPLFADMNAGNWSFGADSPLHKIGFAPLPMPIC